MIGLRFCYRLLQVYSSIFLEYMELCSLLQDFIERAASGSNWKAARRAITTKYGYYTLVVGILLLLIVPYYDRIHTFLSKALYNRLLKKLQSDRLRRRGQPGNLNLFKLISSLLIILTALSLLQTNGDLGFIAARLGRVPTYCLPTVLFLTLRPSPLPNTLYLRLIPVHKWLSRIVVLQALLHTIIYLIYYQATGTMRKIQKPANIAGVIAMASFIMIVLTSLPKVRRSFYRTFFVSHYLSTWIAVVALYYHARPPIPYLTALNVVILLWQSVIRFKLSSITTLKVHEVSNTTCIVELPNGCIVNKSGLPGCHIRIIQFDSNWFKRFYKLVVAPEQHPYTLATLPVDASQKLIVRKGDFDLDSHTRYMVTGSFLPFLQFIRPLNSPNPKSLAAATKAQKALIVVGGSAISFALPILRVLAYNGSMVKVVWVIRDHDDLKILDFFKNILVNDDCIDIYITGKYSSGEKLRFKEAVEVLHRRRREMEALEERQMMGFDDSSSSDKPEPLQVPKESATPQTSYNSSTESDPEFEGLNASQDRKKSRISLRDHHQNKFSYAEENKFENIDLELGGIGRNERAALLSSIPAAAPYYSANEISEPETARPDMGYYPIADKLGPRKTPTSSSELYDDLADYWVLKGLSCKIDFGRPVLGLYYYNWCIGSSCIGPMVDLNTGQPICYNTISGNNSWEDELFNNADFIRNRNVRFRDRGGRPDDRVWVIGAGPRSLVDKAGIWAENCGFQFHAECFST